MSVYGDKAKIPEKERGEINTKILIIRIRRVK